jgi:hypothetical protein
MVLVIKMSGKRAEKRKRLSIDEKIEVLKRIKLGHSQIRIAEEFGVGRATVSDIKRDSEKIYEFANQFPNVKSLKDRKSLKWADHKEVEDAFCLWFNQEREKGTPLSGPICMEKALQFALQIEGENTEFKASQGWFDRLKKRRGIKELKIDGERLSADDSQVSEFKDKLEVFMKDNNLVKEQVYNADETGLFYKCLPNKTLAGPTERNAAGFKIDKNRLTVLFCVNATGAHKIRPLFVGKSSNPICFKHVNMKNLPGRYIAQHKSWMTCSSFKMWFNEEFVPSVKKHLRSKGLEEKAVLLIDNCPAHPDAEQLKTADGKISTLFLPKNSTSLFQPLDGGIIANVKKRYRRSLLRKIVNDTEDLVTAVKKITVKDALYMLCEAWAEVHESTCLKIWEKTVFKKDIVVTVIEEDDVPLSELKEILQTANLQIDERVIEQWIEQKEEQLENYDDDDDDKDDDENPSCTNVQNNMPSTSEVLEMFEKIIYFSEAQEWTSSWELTALNSLLRKTSLNRHNIVKQLDIRKFFK